MHTAVFPKLKAKHLIAPMNDDYGQHEVHPPLPCIYISKLLYYILYYLLPITRRSYLERYLYTSIVSTNHW